MLRVLHITAGKLWGGLEALLVAMLRHGDKLPELEQEFALCFDGRLGQELRESNTRVHLLGETRVRYPHTILRARRRLRSALVAGFDVAVCHSAWAFALLAPTIRMTQLPLVWWVHDDVRGRSWVDRWTRHSEPDFVICNSLFTKNRVESVFPTVETGIVYPFVEASTVSLSPGLRAQLRAELDTAADATVIIQVSRMEALKGHHALLQALARLRNVPGWMCWIVGGQQRPEERRYFEDLKRIAAVLGIADRVRFLGLRCDVARLLVAADIFCQPNIRPESFGSVFVEALYAARPVVTSAIGGATEIIDPTCGILTPAGDIEAIRSALSRLIEDRGLRETLGANGPAKADALCNMEVQLHAYQQVLLRLLRNRGLSKSVTARKENSVEFLP